MGWGTAAIQGSFNLANTALEGHINSELAKEARLENYKYGEMAADAADARQRAQWEEMYSINAQMAQLKEAGLNPALMYSNGAGAGGHAEGAQGTGAMGVQAAQVHLTPLDISQIALNQANANKLNAEADTLNGNNKRGQNEIEKIRIDTMKALEEINATAAKADYTRAIKKQQDLQNYITEATTNDQIDTAAAMAEGAAYRSWVTFEEFRSLQLDNKVKFETTDERIEQVKKNLVLTEKQIERIEKENLLTDQEIATLKAQIGLWQTQSLKMYFDMFLGVVDANTKRFEANTKRLEHISLKEFREKTIENLNNVLEFDKSKWSDEKVLRWVTSQESFFNDLLSTGVDAVKAVGDIVSPF